MPETAFDATLTALQSLDLQALRWEIEQLRAIKAWALDGLKLDFEPGDRVTITSEEPSEVGRGWAHYGEALAPGQSGIAGEITFNARAKRWEVLVGLDRSWSTHKHDNFRGGRIDRFWNGPPDETPEGYTPPGAYDREHHPGGRLQHFALNVGWVVKSENYKPDPS